MACNITAGRNEVCKDSVGGLAGVYFMNYSTGSFTKSETGELTAVPSGSVVYYYELKGNTSSYTETVNSSRENGTTFFTQELQISVKKLSNEMTTQLKMMAYGRPQAFIHTLQGDTIFAGEAEGLDVTTGTLQTGAALGDLYGYSLTFTGNERLPGSFVSGSEFGDPFGALTTAPTIVFGTNV
jgi:hypothetical protein